MDPMKLRHVKAILNSLKPYLKKLKLKFMDAFVAVGITALESVHFVMRLPPRNRFDKLVEMKTSLRNVRIGLKTGNEQEAAVSKRATAITKVFLELRSIKHLTVFDRDGKPWSVPELR